MGPGLLHPGEALGDPAVRGVLFLAGLLGTPLLVRAARGAGWTLGPAMLLGYAWMLGVLLVARRTGWPSAAGGDRWKPRAGLGRMVGRGLALGVVLFVAGGIGYAVSGSLGVRSGPPGPVEPVGAGGAAVLVSAFAGAAVLEELAFRDRLLVWLQEGVGAWAAVGGQAVLFSLWHLEAGQLLSALLYGVLLGWAARRPGGLGVAVAAHLVLNMAGVTLYLSGAAP